MADPLSVVASIVAVLSASIACVDGLSAIIQDIRNAPNELMALSNEINTLTCIIHGADTVCKSLAMESSSTTQFINTFESLLKEAEGILDDLNSMVSDYKSRVGRLKQTTWWMRQKNPIKIKIVRLKYIGRNISELLTLATVHHNPRVEMQLTDMHSLLNQILQEVDSKSETIIRRLLLRDISPESLSTGKLVNPSGTNNSSLHHIIERSSSLETVYSHSEIEENAGPSILQNRILPDQGDTVIVSETANRSTWHHPVLNYLPSKSVAYLRVYKPNKCEGTLLIGYTGSPLLGLTCERMECQKQTGKFLQLTYCFPRWFLERAVHVVAAMTYIGTATFGLEIRRRIEWGGEDSILRFALTGNTVGVKALLTSGKSSMTDVDPYHGRSALYFAVQYNRIETCEFLLKEGADPYAEDNDGISSYQKAWEQVFMKYSSAESLQKLQRLFPKEQISETWEFSPLHEVVLGILPMSLETTLQDQKYHKQVNLRDYKGRTPLHWAAIRGDEYAVSRLLDCGAEINMQDEGKATPLILAASSGSVRTLELLLLAGANVHLTDRRGGQALHYASRHQKDITPVKLLLQAGASVNCRNSLGHTPFTGAAIKNRCEIGAYLLQNRADMHSFGNNNDTPLFESIFHNSHEFLQLLLREGAKHTSVNKSGSTILHAAALEADLKTIDILDASKPGGLDIDLPDKNGKTALEISKQRVASPDGFQEAFERFLMTVKEANRDI
ncbi:hypothetical protein OIDMADRAFT_182582 [Oidiodendron maius Zn]|uniref:Uncharacterized protein n=1 Tax=Oidiodendron maius (strain Zn) TaxID=913774 RepID=A0A0C3GM43_OIDMZ|nr:hypothetical protein OIDMADRAFT_182582 [Oidiodendron maius Zn]